ncbi:MAG: hypothetical protein AAF192_02345, partial [Pseudomonadota bacterium]
MIIARRNLQAMPQRLVYFVASGLGVIFVWQLTGDIIFAFAAVATFAVAFAFASAFAVVPWLSKRSGRPAAVLASWAILALGAALFAARAAPDLPNGPEGFDPAAWILFLGWLPQLNGLADFASIGLTRWCLRWGLPGGLGRALAAAAVDLIGAAFAFFALGAALILMIGYAVPQTGVPILPLDVAFAELRETPERH